MKYLNRKFSISMMANQKEPVCRCGRPIKVGYATKDGFMCSSCYNNQKRYKLLKNISNLKLPEWDGHW